MWRAVLDRVVFVLMNMVVMVILHGNSKQFWPKIPYLSLRDESTAEHTRLVFNTLAISTLIQALLGRLPRERWLPRVLVLGVVPAMLPAVIFFGQKVLRLQGAAAERYNLAMVPLLPIAAVAVEEGLASQLAPPPETPSSADYSHLV
ncbi:MAG: hypothetical protein N2378_14845 [Chloroflexaceae bacterium]|nr:hypothetical protein [Chloroflexaceae bacterium]